MNDGVPVIPIETRTGPFISSTAPGIGRAENEDITGTFEDHTAWVLDGADDPLADKGKCSHGAIWYVRALHRALQSLSQDQFSLQGLLQEAIQYVKEVHEAECEHPFHRKPSAAVAIFRARFDSIDYLVLGDASILLESSDTVVHVTDRRMHHIGQDIRHAIIDRLRQGHGYDDPERLTLLRELVEQEQRARNTPTGYSIATYDPNAALHSVAKSLPNHGSQSRIDRAALLSDGAERALSTFALCSNWMDFMNFVSNEGPARCIKGIREAELLDYSGKEHPRTKFSDDASITLWTRAREAHSNR